MMSFRPPQKRTSLSGGNLSDDEKQNIYPETKRSNVWENSNGLDIKSPLENGQSMIIPLRRASPASTYSIDSSSGSNRTFIIQEDNDNGDSVIVETGNLVHSPAKRANEQLCEVDIHDFSQSKPKSITSEKTPEDTTQNKAESPSKDRIPPAKLAEVFIMNELSSASQSETSNKPPVPLPRKSCSTPRSAGSAQVLKDNDTPETNGQAIISVSKQSVVAFSNHEDDISPPIKRKPKPRRKKMKKLQEAENDMIELGPLSKEDQVSSEIIDEKQQWKNEAFQLNTDCHSEKNILGVIIHGCDGLVPDLLVCHPLVRVYVVDQNTGEFLKRSMPEKQSNHDPAEFILPLMTQPFDFYNKKSIVPKWEELLLFNEAPETLLKPTTLFLFEVIDLLSFSLADCQYAQFGSESAWHHIAWAFLKIMNEHSHSNLNKKLRLQLFQPKHRTLSQSKSKLPHLFWWYKSRCFKPYPSTLYVTVKTMPILSEFTSGLKSSISSSQEMRPTDGLQSLKFFHSESKDNECLAGNLTDQVLPDVKWTRLIGQSCKLPNSKLLSLNIHNHGALSVQFSWSGLLLASAASSHIYIHTIPHGQLFCLLSGHQGLVYSLRWSSDDSLLLSASADCTVCIWHILEVKKPKLLQMLPHPSYIYCAIFINKYIVVSGCCDGVIRLWLCTKKIGAFELSQELSVHCGFVNSICYSDGILYSADSVGVIISWISQDDRWILSKEYIVSELAGININNILMHPGGKRMIIHSRDSQLRMMDLATGAIIQWYQGCLNEKLQTGSCLSQCGGILFAWSEEGILVAWNTDTGEQIGIYSEDNFTAGCGCIHYHPHDHIAAFSVHSVRNNSSLVVGHYQRGKPINGIGLTLVQKSSCEAQDVKSQGRPFKWEKLYSQALAEQPSFSKPTKGTAPPTRITIQNINSKTVETPQKVEKSSKKSLFAKSISILSGSESNLLNKDILLKTERKKKSEKWKKRGTKNMSSSVNSSSNRSISMYDNLSFEMGNEGINTGNVLISSELPDDLIHDQRLANIIHKIDKVLLSSQ
nr:PREDICTED: jouberin-like isoform X1 [Bemisia tabaci]